MKKIFATSALALTMGATSAFAGALGPVPTEPMIHTPAPVAPVAMARTWTGGYGGVQLGYGQSRLSLTDQFNGDDLGTARNSGMLGGVYGGFNWQGGNNTVFGIDADLTANRARDTFDTDTGGEVSTNMRASGALRARAGLAMGDTLFYGAAGVAHARFDVGFNGSDENITRTGWTAGVGVEQAFGGNMTGRLEYRHTDYGSFETGGFDGRLRSNEVRAGVAFNF